ncbi:MAG TPA: glycoside hydrolase family 92 protein, partial [Bacteroidetes bacterium]|nr:glycoside hydrolase family 92 protein [Bacteroidota bacterium]
MKRLQTRYWHLPFLSVIALFICGCSQKSNTPKETSSSHHLCQYVNPFIGTGGHGHTFPGATLPFGMVQISPDTRLKGWDGCSAYHDSDSIIYGFSHTHLSGTGVSDYGDILFMPMTGPALLQNGHGISPDSGYASRFDKTSETASPGYYSVFLKDYGIKAELTATERVGFHRYTAPISQEIHLILDLEHRDPLRESHITIHNHRKISGYRRSSAWAKDQWIYFQAEFSRPFTHHEIQTQNINAQINEVKARFTFASAGDSALLVKVSISPTNKNGPPANMLAEIPGWNFDKIRQQADSIWNQQLHKIVVEGGTKTQQRIFYTALYHSMLAPNLFSDAKGNYRGMDGKSHALKASRQYTVFSLWDTFRATHPLFTIIEQQRTEAFIQTFLRQYQEGGQLPVWELAGNYTGCMIGYHAISVIADAYLKGLRNFDAERALEAMQHSAEQNHLGLEYYKKQGFIGAGDESESVSKTLEYAYDDWCIAMMAKEMGKYAVYKKYIQRAQFYINLYDPKTGFFRAKMNGSWQEPFDPREVNFNYTEANAWQYSLFVPQDISGLIHLMGGKAQFVQHLDSLFLIGSTTTGREQADITGLIGQYAHGNEPSHHMAYLYSYAGESPKTQQRVREILQNMYHDQPDGLSGNEDCGQMSAWYVLSAMGFYPVTPGSDQYVIGSPLFSRTTIHLENGEVFRIVAEDVSAENMYIQSAELNGEPLGRLFLRQQDLMSGGELRLKMGATAQAAWAGPKPELPASSIETGERIAAVPFFVAGSETFTDSLQV